MAKTIRFKHRSRAGEVTLQWACFHLQSNSNDAVGCVSTKIQLCVLGALKLELARLNEDQGKFKDYRSWFGQLGCLRVVLEQSRTMINNSRDLWENNEMLDSLSLSLNKSAGCLCPALACHKATQTSEQLSCLLINTLNMHRR